MKQPSSNSSSIVVSARFAALLLVAGTLSACGTMSGHSASGGGAGIQAKTVTLAASEQIPAAQGQVRVKDAGNNNTQIDLSINHLAPPQKIDAQATTFMVWAKPSSELRRAQPLGALVVDKDLQGKLTATTPYRNFEVFVTAETSSQVEDPSGDRLLWGTVTQSDAAQ